MTFAAGWEVLRMRQLSQAEETSNDGLIFFVISLGIVIWSIWTLLSRVELRKESVSVRNPFGKRNTVEFRQVVNAVESGRMGNSISLLYYPIGENGLVNLDDAETLSLPKVQNQDELLQHFRERIPA